MSQFCSFLFFASCWCFFFKNAKPWGGGGGTSCYRRGHIRVALSYLAFGHIWAGVSQSLDVGTEIVIQG